MFLCDAMDPEREAERARLLHRLKALAVGDGDLRA